MRPLFRLFADADHARLEQSMNAWAAGLPAGSHVVSAAVTCPQPPAGHAAVVVALVVAAVPAVAGATEID